MLERVALHQTRLRVPGVGLDARGVAVGAKGLVLLPSLDRLVAFLAVYTESETLDSLVGSLQVQVVRSKLGTSEVVLVFDAGSSDRMDRLAEVARLTGGFAFTGTSRHFVQYRDRSAPFGFDAEELLATDADLALYHNTFNQTYRLERSVELSKLLLRLMPQPEPAATLDDREVWVLCEGGLGPSVLLYLTRSGVEARAGIAEWPPETSFDDTPVRRWLFQIPSLPERMRATFTSTPGMTVFVPAGPGAAVEHAFRHPISLRACPVFRPEGLVLFRGHGLAPLVVDPVPMLGDLRSLYRAEVSDTLQAQVASTGLDAPAVRVPVRLVPSTAPPSAVSASLVPANELGLLRRLAYALGATAIRGTRIAVTRVGAFLLREDGLEPLPLGVYYRRVHPQLFVPSGMEVVPMVEPEVLYGALGSPTEQLLFFRPDGGVVGVQQAGFVPLESALLESERWVEEPALSFEAALATETPTVWLEPLGMRPLRSAEADD